MISSIHNICINFNLRSAAPAHRAHVRRHPGGGPHQRVRGVDGGRQHRQPPRQARRLHRVRHHEIPPPDPPRPRVPPLQWGSAPGFERFILTTACSITHSTLISFPFVRCQFTGGHFWSPSENSRLRGCGEDDVQVDCAWGVPRPAPRNHRLHGARGAARRQLREVVRHLVARLLHHRDGHGQAALGGLGCFQSPRANISGETF